MSELIESGGKLTPYMKKRAALAQLCVERDLTRMRSESQKLKIRVCELEVAKAKADMLVEVVDDLTLEGNLGDMQIGVDLTRADIGAAMMRRGQLMATAEEDDFYHPDVEASSAIDHAETQEEVATRVIERITDIFGEDI